MVAESFNGDILCTVHSQRGTNSHAFAVGDGHIAGAGDIRFAIDGRSAGVGSNRDILRVGDRQGADSGRTQIITDVDNRLTVAGDGEISGHKVFDRDGLGDRVILNLLSDDHIIFIETGDFHVVDSDTVVGAPDSVQGGVLCHSDDGV